MKQKKRSSILIIVLVVLVLIFLAFTLSTKEKSSTLKICFEKICIDAEVADSPEERTQGLMFRESLPQNHGMIFIFEGEGIYPFWMKNTLIPLDIIWLNENKEVVKIMQTLPCMEEPCEIYNPEVQARYVIEINGGFAEENNIQVGDSADF